MSTAPSTLPTVPVLSALLTRQQAFRGRRRRVCIGECTRSRTSTSNGSAYGTLSFLAFRGPRPAHLTAMTTFLSKFWGTRPISSHESYQTVIDVLRAHNQLESMDGNEQTSITADSDIFAQQVLLQAFRSIFQEWRSQRSTSLDRRHQSSRGLPLWERSSATDEIMLTARVEHGSSIEDAHGPEATGIDEEESIILQPQDQGEATPPSYIDPLENHNYDLSNLLDSSLIGELDLSMRLFP